ncbi:peptidoglycan-binding domain-containing protein [Nocardioides coralli]|uniref:peptidoglycan-binding domain-containing protein n=1 Tax=Nocardioides coralli TaxID=2872154 RepID=UPI001CA3C19A|nr:peptidoglycan-binding domain-containing protein [Nocardioides coralli]QZY28959.1 peptidoglycan-binding protein [Nocardioides coralli]
MIHPRISASVGAGGSNGAPDVRVVQDLLNRAADAGLDVDGACGSLTIGAITDYQQGFLRRPDGRVDPEGLTLRKLRDAAGARPQRPPGQGGGSSPSGGASSGTRLQALGSGKGFYSYARTDRQFAGDPLLGALRDVGHRLARAGLEYGVGDLSFEQGGTMRPHKTHTAGRHADLRPIRSDAGRSPTNINDPSYSRDSTRLLVESLQAQSSIDQILFNDREIAGVKQWPAHDNHLHVRVR